MASTARLIHLTVLDAAGRPVAGARVYVVSAPVAMPDVAALSDPQGRFTLGAPKAGRYEIGASSDSHGSAQATLDVGDQGATLQLRLPR